MINNNYKTVGAVPCGRPYDFYIILSFTPLNKSEKYIIIIKNNGREYKYIMKYLGIDGGGTKTSFCLTDGSLNILSEYHTTGLYYPEIGKDGVVEVINKGIDICLKKANVDLNDVKAYCGMPVFGEHESLDYDLPEIKSRVSVPMGFCNDVEVCHAGALGYIPGIAVIAGTGSIGFGRDEFGNKTRSGGFGPEPNGDEGSAYYIGLRLMNKFTRQSDYREDRTLLYGEVKKALNFKRDFDVEEFLIEKLKTNRASIAELSLLAYDIAMMGDPACISIFSEAAYEIYLLAAAIKKQLKFQELPIKVSYAGGVFKSGDLVLAKFGELLKQNDMILTKPRYSPVIGACILARDATT